jgi:hypothetical protein
MGEASTLAQESPKLLTLDKADVRAIRSFLPGKVLGRTAALLALVVLVLGFATSVDVGLERFLGFPLEPRWLRPLAAPRLRADHAGWLALPISTSECQRASRSRRVGSIGRGWSALLPRRPCSY